MFRIFLKLFTANLALITLEELRIPFITSTLIYSGDLLLRVGVHCCELSVMCRLLTSSSELLGQS